jgi:glycosyltransferase involved in cell wall biosynthesis
MTPPAVSVVMPVHNGAGFLTAAIDSILAQSFTDFEFIIVDDGSDDATPEILARFAASDSRIHVTRQHRAGVANALNRGLAASSGSFIARIDADDIARPSRLARQLELLQAQPNVAVLGTAYELIDLQGATHGIRQMPTSAAEIHAGLLHGNYIAHPTVMMRRDAVVAAGGYRPAFVSCEDYDLWLRLSESHELLNLDAPLLLYRMHPGQSAWRDADQRILAEVGAVACAWRRRAGAADPAIGVSHITRDFLSRIDVPEHAIRAEILRRSIGAARDALANRHRDAARRILALARAQTPLRLRTRLRWWSLRARCAFPITPRP